MIGLQSTDADQIQHIANHPNLSNALDRLAADLQAESERLQMEIELYEPERWDGLG